METQILIELWDKSPMVAMLAVGMWFGNRVFKAMQKIIEDQTAAQVEMKSALHALTKAVDILTSKI